MNFNIYLQPWEMNGLSCSLLSAGLMRLSTRDVDFWNLRDNTDWTIAPIRRWSGGDGFGVVARRRVVGSAP